MTPLATYLHRFNIVFRVHPLPESLMDYVWDYGALEPTEEELYIRSIVTNNIDSALVDLFTDLIAQSQECIPSPPHVETSMTSDSYSNSWISRKCEHARREKMHQTRAVLQRAPYCTRVKQSQTKSQSKQTTIKQAEKEPPVQEERRQES